MIKIKSNNLPIQNFTIYAERHTGTNFLAQYISKIYDNFQPGLNSIPITYDYGWKHFFGFSDDKIIDSGHNTLFIGIIRNPYDWLMAVKRMPHHMRKWSGRMDKNPFMDNIDFLTSEIESYHNSGLEIMEDRHILEKRRYKNIFELRETKNIYLTDTMPKIAQNYILINYEILNTNIESFVMTLNNNFNLKHKTHLPNTSHKKPYFIDDESLIVINKSLNWTTENSLGYDKTLSNWYTHRKTN